MNDIGNILSSFDSVELKDIGSVKLMNRTDTKYVFPKTKLHDVLHDLAEYYYILEINNKSLLSYKTLYYDSPEFDCYYMHQFGRANRYKCRTREYVETGTTYFELKVKNNHKKTYKSRILRKSNNFDIKKKQIKFVDNKINKSIENFKGVLWVEYKRISLVSKSFTERLTIDIDLQFSNEDKHKEYQNLVILELKQDRTQGSVAKTLLQSKKIFSQSLSKYCLGIASIYPVKRNNINKKIRLINKLSYESV